MHINENIFMKFQLLKLLVHKILQERKKLYYSVCVKDGRLYIDTHNITVYTWREDRR